MVYNVVDANLMDILDVTDILRHLAFLEQYISYSDIGHFSNEELSKNLEGYIQDDLSYFRLVKDQDCKIAAIGLGYLYKPIITKASYLRAQDTLIQPAYYLSKKEKAVTFNLLVEDFEEWAKAKGAMDLFIGVNVRHDITKSMERKGFQVADILMKKELKSNG